MAERNISPNEENSSSRPLRPRHPGIIDGNFLSVAFTGALVVIIAVAIYAFYNLYHAILKKFPSHHTELWAPTRDRDVDVRAFCFCVIPSCFKQKKNS